MLQKAAKPVCKFNSTQLMSTLTKIISKAQISGLRSSKRECRDTVYNKMTQVCKAYWAHCPHCVQKNKRWTVTCPNDVVSLLWIRFKARRGAKAISGSIKRARSWIRQSVVKLTPWCSQNSFASASSSNANCRVSSDRWYWNRIRYM